MTREQFADLQRGDRVRDRQGRVWTATADARDTGPVVEVWLRAGDRSRRVTSWDAGDYELVEGSG